MIMFVVVFLIAFKGAFCIDICKKGSNFDTEVLGKIKLNSDVPALPWIEGEHYATTGSQIKLQCTLPLLPADSVVLLTYTPNWVKNIRNVMIKYRNPNETMEYFVEPDSCTITALSANLTEAAIPNGVPPRCGKSRSIMMSGRSRMTTEISDDTRNHHLGYSVHPDSKLLNLEFPSVLLNQTGSYQCIILRTCDPGIWNKTQNPEDQDKHAVGIYKSVFVKVYNKPEYKDDMVIACSGLGVGTVALLLAVFISRGSKFE